MKPQAASLGRRLGALIYDSIIVFGLLMFTTTCIVIFNHGKAVAPRQWWLSLLLLSVMYGYFALSWMIGGQTIGMRAWRLRLQTCSGEPMNIWHALLRFGFAIPSILSAGLGLWWSLWDRQGLAWHDHWSGTYLILHPRGLPRGSLRDGDPQGENRNSPLESPPEDPLPGCAKL